MGNEPDPGTHTVYAIFNDGSVQTDTSDDIYLDTNGGGGPVCGNSVVEA